MSRSKIIKKRPVETDPLYKSRVVNRVINKVMVGGRKELARNLVYKALAKINEDKKEALRIFEQAIKNIMPQQEVRSRRVGGANYQIPIPLKHDRSEALAIRWLVDLSRKQKGKDFDEILAAEIQSAINNQGEAIKKRDDMHRMAEANKAFAHFRW
ncbi:MAG: 30S ribosomal protein S7 [bacterium]|nr:30S ribosomal protein S7 [bacterium]